MPWRTFTLRRGGRARPPASRPRAAARRGARAASADTRGDAWPSCDAPRRAPERAPRSSAAAAPRRCARSARWRRRSFGDSCSAGSPPRRAPQPRRRSVLGRRLLGGRPPRPGAPRRAASSAGASSRLRRGLLSCGLLGGSLLRGGLLGRDLVGGRLVGRLLRRGHLLGDLVGRLVGVRRLVLVHVLFVLNHSWLSACESRSRRRFRAGAPRSARAPGPLRLPQPRGVLELAGRVLEAQVEELLARCPRTPRAAASSRLCTSTAFTAGHRPRASRTWSSREACGRPGASPRARAAPARRPARTSRGRA